MGFDLYAHIHAIARQARRSGLTQWADRLQDTFSVAMTSTEAHRKARWELEQLVISLGDGERPLSRHATHIVDEIAQAIG